MEVTTKTRTAQRRRGDVGLSGLMSNGCVRARAGARGSRYEPSDDRRRRMVATTPSPNIVRASVAGSGTATRV